MRRDMDEGPVIRDGDREAERLRCLHIDDQLGLGGLLRRQLGRIRALQTQVGRVKTIDPCSRAASKLPC